MVNIRLCDFSEFENLKSFIHKDWSNNHILATHDDLLKWQHYNKLESKLNFIVASDALSGDLVGILGFIPLSQYDQNIISNKDFWLAIWKIKNGYPGIGVELLNYFTELYNPNSIGSIGINKVVRKLYKILKYKTGTVDQYYLLNPAIKNFKIAEIEGVKERPVPRASIYIIKKIQNLSVVADLQHSYSPQKSMNYLSERYANHPIYNYKFYGVFMGESVKCVLVTRKISINGTSCLRIVDVFGSLELDSIESELVKLLEAEKSEYIDCLNYGIAQSTFLNLGFSLREDVIIPNYFEPFLRANVDILIAYKSNYSNYVVFKGDSDQDRPTKI